MSTKLFKPPAEAVKVYMDTPRYKGGFAVRRDVLDLFLSGEH
jgi:hypothetical protein